MIHNNNNNNNLQKSNFGQAQYTRRLSDDGPHGPKHIGVTVKKCFNVNFNILCFIC